MRFGTVLAASLTSGDVHLVIAGLLLLSLVTVLSPVLLALVYRKTRLNDQTGHQLPTSFFQLPYITWFLIHMYVAMLGIIAVVGLGIAGSIDKTTIAALLSGLFGYVLGNAAHAASSSASNAKKPPVDSQ